MGPYGTRWYRSCGYSCGYSGREHMTDSIAARINELLRWPEPTLEPISFSDRHYDFGMTPHATIRVIKDRRPIADIEIDRDSTHLEIRGRTGYEVINQKMLTT